MINLCGCKYAKVENDGGRSETWYYICRLHGQMTDPRFCSGCPNKDDGKVKKDEALERKHGLLQPCPFCGSIPDVRNGSYLCKKCRLVMYIPFRNYKSVKDMLDQTWNKRWKDNDL